MGSCVIASLQWIGAKGSNGHKRTTSLPRIIFFNKTKGIHLWREKKLPRMWMTKKSFHKIKTKESTKISGKKGQSIS